MNSPSKVSTVRGKTIPIAGAPSYSLASILMEESLSIAGRAIGVEGVGIPPLHAPIFEALGRSIRLMRGVRTLIESRLLGEAFILGRSLFEDSLRMAEIRYSDRERQGLILELQWQGPAEMENLLREMHASQQHANAWQNMPAKIADQRRALEQLAKQFGLERVSFKSGKDAAYKYGRMHDYWTYRWAHSMAHGSIISHAPYRRSSGGADVGPWNLVTTTESDSPELATSCANWCARSLLQVTGAFAVVFGKDYLEADREFERSNELENHLFERAGYGPALRQPSPPRGEVL